MKHLKNLIFTVSFTLLAFSVSAQLQQKPNSPPKKTRILFLLDGSGSMNGDWKNEVRIDAAKEILENLVDSLKTYDKLELALRIYGHQSHRDLKNCKDTRLETPFSPNNHKAIKDKLESLVPKGVTPLAYSLEQAANDFPKERNVRNIIIIITDGLESCDGDPCKVSLALQRKNIFLKPFVIGIGIEKDYSKEFACIGTFYNATDPNSFKIVLQKVISQALEKTDVRVDLMDSKDKATESNVNISFINNITLKTEYDIVHYIGTSGKSDLLNIDPVISYNIRVNTIPPVYKKNVHLEGGKLNIIRIPTPQGYLTVKQDGYLEYKGLEALVRKKGSKEIIHTFTVGKSEPVKLLTGEYEIEILTLPRIIKKAIIKAKETTTLRLSKPGRMTIVDHKVGFGSIYELSKDGRERWIYNLPVASSRTSVAIQPGKYKVVYRSQNARGAENTYVNKFTIKSGASTSIKLFQ